MVLLVISWEDQGVCQNDIFVLDVPGSHMTQLPLCIVHFCYHYTFLPELGPLGGKPLLKAFQGQRTTEHVGSNQDQEAYSLGLRQGSGDVVTVLPSIHSVGTWANLTLGKQKLIFYADNEVWLTCQYGRLLLLMEAEGWLQKDVDYLQKWPQLFLFAVWFFSFPIKHPFPNPLSLSWPHHLFWPNTYQSRLCSPSRCNKMWPAHLSEFKHWPLVLLCTSGKSPNSILIHWPLCSISLFLQPSFAPCLRCHYLSDAIYLDHLIEFSSSLNSSSLSCLLVSVQTAGQDCSPWGSRMASEVPCSMAVSPFSFYSTSLRYLILFSTTSL